MISNGNSFSGSAGDSLGATSHNSISISRGGPCLHLFDVGPDSAFQRLGNAL